MSALTPSGQWETPCFDAWWTCPYVRISRIKPMTDESRERALEAALFHLYEAWAELPIPAGKTRRYYAHRFRQMIVPGCKKYKGGVRAVQGVLCKSTAGFERLKPHPNLTVEYLVASGEWDDLFDESYRHLARARLAERLK